MRRSCELWVLCWSFVCDFELAAHVNRLLMVCSWAAFFALILLHSWVSLVAKTTWQRQRSLSRFARSFDKVVFIVLVKIIQHSCAICQPRSQSNAHRHGCATRHCPSSRPRTTLPQSLAPSSLIHIAYCSKLHLVFPFQSNTQTASRNGSPVPVRNLQQRSSARSRSMHPSPRSCCCCCSREALPYGDGPCNTQRGGDEGGGGGCVGWGGCAVEAEGVLRVHEPRVCPAFGSDRVSVCICISLVSQSHM